MHAATLRAFKDLEKEVRQISRARCYAAIIRDAKVASEPVALINWLKFVGMNLGRIGLEAGPLSQWLYGAL